MTMNFELSVGYALQICLIFLASFFIKGMAGFGEPLLASPLLALSLPNSVISPALLFPGMPINAYMVWQNRAHVSLKRIVPVTVLVLVGIIPGVLLLKYAASAVLKVLLGLLIIAIGVQMLTQKSERQQDVSAAAGPRGAREKLVMAAVCLFSGLTGGLYAINMFFIPYIEKVSQDRNEFRGNICFVFLAENVCRLIAYAVGGVLTKEVWWLLLMAAPGIVLGMLIGIKVEKKLSEAKARLFVIIIFMLGGAGIILKTLIPQRLF
jgi:uncharacterized membrane protein YfcA